MTNEDLDYLAAYGALFTAIPIQRLIAGDKRSAGTLFEDVADTNTKQVVVANNTSDHFLLVFEPNVRGSGQVYTRKIKNPDIDTAGDAAALVNAKTDDGTPLDVSVTTAGDGETGAISGGTNYPQLTAGSGSNLSNASPGESGATGITDAVAAGDSLAIEAQNQAGSPQDVSITAEFIAFPASEIDKLPF